MKQKNSKVVKYRKHSRLDFISIIFLIILVYLIVQVIGYFSKDKVKIFEVEAPITYSSNPSYTGFISRNEITYLMEQEGYINYYICEGKKARVGSTVAIIDKTGDFSALLKSLYPNGISIDDADLASIKSSLVHSSSSFSPAEYGKFYENKYYINASILDGLNLSALESTKNKEISAEFQKLTAPLSGFILYQKDNFSGLTPKELTMKEFDQKNYHKEIFTPGEKRNKDDFAYQCVPDDSFTITFPLSELDEKIYGENNYLKIYLKSLGVTVNGKLSLITSSDDQRMGVIELSKYGSSYLTERYIDFSIVEKDITGVKVPISSVFEKNFYTVPKEFLTTGGEKSVKGINKESAYGDTASINFIPVTVAASDETVCYIDSKEISDGDILIKPDSSEKYTIHDTAPVTGVYNINQGYSVFRRVDILDTTKDKGYYIVDINTPGGLNTYDHIVMDASLIKENELIY